MPDDRGEASSRGHNADVSTSPERDAPKDTLELIRMSHGDLRGFDESGAKPHGSPLGQWASAVLRGTLTHTGRQACVTDQMLGCRESVDRFDFRDQCSRGQRTDARNRLEPTDQVLIEGMRQHGLGGLVDLRLDKGIVRPMIVERAIVGGH